MSQVKVPPEKKIKTLDDLAAILADLRGTKRVVHCHGVFDLLHVGHLRHFESAKKHGDILVVTLTPDHFVNKGPHRPAFASDFRLEMIAALQCVDFVALNQWPTAVPTIDKLRPHVFAKGGEFRNLQDVTGAVGEEAEAIRRVGGEVIFTDDDVVFSSSTLINRHMPVVGKEASEYLTGFAARHPAASVQKYLDGAKGLNVLVVGESIIDEYSYCQTLGKSGKEPILAVRAVSDERFAGGNLAVANHVAAFADRVNLLSFLGRDEWAEPFARSKLRPHVAAEFFATPGNSTIVKRRFIEKYPFQKLFEVYQLDEEADDPAERERFHAALREALPRYDLVIVTDYGHGMLDPEAVRILSREAKCLAVNTQMNAANHGFNTVSKYPRADYVCVSENEIRLEARQRRQELKSIVSGVADRLGCRQVMVTQGRQGVLCFDRADGFVRVPAFVDHFTDRVGAGDTVFAVTSLCFQQQAPAEVLGVLANATGAIAVGVVGNRTPIDRVALARTITSIVR